MALKDANDRLAKIEANTKLAYEICKTWSVPKGGDVEPFFAFFHDMTTPHSRPWLRRNFYLNWRERMNKQGFREWGFNESRITDLSVKVEGITASEDRLALEASSNMEVNGNSYCNVYHWLFEIREGKISAARFYLDTLFAEKAIEWMEEITR